MSISFVWFDLGYTLLYQQREEPYRAVLAGLGHDVPLGRLELEYHLADKLFMREYPGVFGLDPETFAPWFLGVLNHRLGIRTNLCETWRLLKQAATGAPGAAAGRAGGGEGHAGWFPFPGVPEALADLRGRGYRLGVISNWDASARPLLARLGLEGFFEQVVVSCECGCEKPSRRIFEVALSAAGVDAGACLYVGDNYYVDTLGAREVGMSSVVVNRFGRRGIEELADVPVISHVAELAGLLRSERG